MACAPRPAVGHQKATNAIKVYLSEECGKTASNLTEADFAAHVSQWHEELHVLADASVMPHAIVVFGRAIWPHAWHTFHPNHHGLGQRVSKYEAIWEDAPHRMNRIVIGGAVPHELLLVRLRHPSRAAKQGAAKWLINTQAFRKTVAASR